MLIIFFSSFLVHVVCVLKYIILPMFIHFFAGLRGIVAHNSTFPRIYSLEYYSKYEKNEIYHFD
jgi:hypothetical protein